MSKKIYVGNLSFRTTEEEITGLFGQIGAVETVANDLQSVLKAADKLRQIGDAHASLRPAPGKWSKKEILGHLVDSAANNHQRFVRLQLTSRVDLPGYDGDEWVRVQRYQDRP